MNSRYPLYINETIASHINDFLEQAAETDNDLLSLISTLQKLIVLHFFHASAPSYWNFFNTSHHQLLNQINNKFVEYTTLSNEKFIDFVDKFWREAGPDHYLNIAHQISYLRTYYYAAERVVASEHLSNDNSDFSIEFSLKLLKGVYRDTFENFLNVLHNISDPNAIRIALETLDKAVGEQLEIQTNSIKSVVRSHDHYIYKTAYFFKYFILDEMIYILMDIYRIFVNYRA